MIGRELLDDLEEGETRVRLDLGDLMVVGTYQGLVKIDTGDGKRWCVSVQTKRYLEAIETRRIHKIERLR